MADVRMSSFVLMLCFCLCSSGCSIFRSSTESITVSADQHDANIYINGALAGQGTAQTYVRRNKNVSIMVTKEGYISVQRSIDKTLSNTGMLDVVGGCIFLLPFFGLLAPGAYSLDQNNVSVILVKVP